MNKIHSGYVYVDVAKLEELLLRKGITKTDFAMRADRRGISRRTVEAVFNPAKRNQMSKVIEVLDLLDAPNDFDTYLCDGDPTPGVSIKQWEIDQRVSDWTVTENGLLYRVYRLRHVHLPSRFGRGKYFDLDDLSDDDQQSVQHYLLRHAEVCDRLASSPAYPASLQLEHSADKKYFWVIDVWPEGEQLTSRAKQPLDGGALARFMLQLLAAIKHAHERGVILRNLNPNRVYLTEHSLQITDFELAKLSDGSPTVTKGESKPCPYVAPEVGGPSIDTTADLYSWAQICLFAATGTHPAMPGRADEVSAQVFPATVRKAMQQCLAIDASDRPQDNQKIMASLKKWSDKVGA